jgi:uncharacterized protein YccT (UPF0319 family)
MNDENKQTIRHFASMANGSNNQIVTTPVIVASFQSDAQITQPILPPFFILSC